MTRRTLVAAATAAACLPAAAQDKPYLVGGFTKALQHLTFDQLAQTAAALGWDGIACAVRPGGHVLPERAADDLPRLVEALGKRSLRLLVMTTAIHDPTEPHTEALLRTARHLGIQRYRLGQSSYKPDVPIPRQLEDIAAQLKDPAAHARSRAGHDAHCPALLEYYGVTVREPVPLEVRYTASVAVVNATSMACPPSVAPAGTG